MRTHPDTKLGKFNPPPGTIVMPMKMQKTTEALLKGHSNKHLHEVMEEIALMTPTRQGAKKEWRTPPHKSALWVAGCLPVDYARSMTCLTEAVRRLGTGWVGDVKRVLDIGTDGAGVLAWKNCVDAVKAGQEVDFARDAEGTSIRERREDEVDRRLSQGKDAGIEIIDELEMEEEVPIEEAAEGELIEEFVEKAPEEVVEEVSKELAIDAEEGHAEAAEEATDGAAGNVANKLDAEENPEKKVKLREATSESTKAPFQSTVVTKSAPAEMHLKAQLWPIRFHGVLPNPDESNSRFDLIIANNFVLPIKDPLRKKQLVRQLHRLLTPNGVLVLMGEGSSKGFLAMAEARDILLKPVKAPVKEGEMEFDEEDVEWEGEGVERAEEKAAESLVEAVSEQSSPAPEAVESTSEGEAPSEEPAISSPAEKAPAYIIAPCTNQSTCPLADSNLSRKRNNCLHTTRYRLPNYLHRLLPPKFSQRNHKDTEFSYLISTPASSALLPPTLPNAARLIDIPLKRRGHIILDVCPPSGRIERWTVTKTQGRVEYRDARKSQWGDLWALDAKVKQRRALRFRKGEEGKEGKAERRKQREKEKEIKQILEMGDEEELRKKVVKGMLHELEEGKEVLQ